MMLKWDSISQYKSVRAAQKAFLGASKEVNAELRRMADERHLLKGLKDERTSKKTPDEQTQMKVVEAVPITLSESS